LTSGDLQTPLPTTTFERLDGRRAVLGQTDGKPIVINLWASWCPPCRREMPLLAKVAARRDDVAFLFVNQGEDKAKINSYLASSGLSLSDVLLDPLGEAARHYQTPGLPSTLFVGTDGKLRFRSARSPQRRSTRISVVSLGAEPLQALPVGVATP
jgi:thiol-disulfide isomerase/thioredoxin